MIFAVEIKSKEMREIENAHKMEAVELSCIAFGK